MFCPVCRMSRDRNGWTAAQWLRQEPLLEWLQGCTQCMAGNEPCSEPEPLMQDTRMQKRLLLQYKKSVLSPKKAERMFEFIAGPWNSLPPDYRKSLSRLGGVTSTDADHPRHWHIPGRGDCFDPGSTAIEHVRTCISSRIAGLRCCWAAASSQGLHV